VRVLLCWQLHNLFQPIACIWLFARVFGTLFTASGSLHTSVLCRKKKIKRKVSRQAAGVSSSALQEAHDIFGDVEDLLERRKMELEREAANSGEMRGKRLEDEFEPFILAEKYMTAKDEQIKENDVPERMQVCAS
jgi:hypothetical protein